MLFCVFSFSPHTHYVFSLSIPPWQFTWPLLGHLPDCLICSFMLGNSSACLWVTALRLNAWQEGERRPYWEIEEETKRFHFQLEAKKQRLQSTRGRGGIRSLGFQLCQFEVRIREKHSENTQQVPKHFPQHQKNCTWQQLMAATAGSWTEEHAAHVFSAYDM